MQCQTWSWAAAVKLRASAIVDIAVVVAGPIVVVGTVRLFVADSLGNSVR